MMSISSEGHSLVIVADRAQLFIDNFIPTEIWRELAVWTRDSASSA